MSELCYDSILTAEKDDTSLCRLGLIGAGIAKSLSPMLYQAEAAAQNIQCQYSLFDLDDPITATLAELLDMAQEQQFKGLNITIPCKQEVIPLLHELSPEARAIGAVNTVCFHNNRRIGYNTDAKGFRECFERYLSGVGLSRVLQFGAGGVGAATAFTLLQLGVQQLTIVDVVQKQALQLADRLQHHFPDRNIRLSLTPKEDMAQAVGIVNATPIGTLRYPGTVMPLSFLRADMWVADVVYSPAETALLHAARAMGCQTLDGVNMLVYQAVRAFELFTGSSADVTRMLRNFKQL
ncbi:shikimate dehydrogenase [Shewanella sp. VB17]|uniref:shikimate dehydrogenase n=1 Tax=Shewanella sp. VB17 TaxID=2739432 RepID=UPI00156465B5|nr:shikimate dehydrogenase [Shewanella sp. VB17]NRD72194.1 shikimate dehydrogenase [Shewanella sp. VB17]